jgi:hypothetical protein
MLGSKEDRRNCGYSWLRDTELGLDVGDLGTRDDLPYAKQQKLELRTEYNTVSMPPSKIRLD